MALCCANQFKSALLTATSYTTDRALPHIKWNRNKYRWVSLVPLAYRLKRSVGMWREEPSTGYGVKSLVQHVAVLGFFFVLDGLVGTKLIGWTYTLALGGMLGTYLSMRGTLLHLLICSCISLSVDTVSSS